MEKNVFPDRSLKRILITGPESTGKSELAVSLARHFGGINIPEFAREYITNLNRPYEYKDVEHIAREQTKEYDKSKLIDTWVFFDTWLIITRVWFDVVYEIIPDWMDDRVRQSHFDLVLLCAPDIPWISDSVRESGGEKRTMLFEKYKYELDRFGFDWVLVTGNGDQRLNRAIKLINKNITNGTS